MSTEAQTIALHGMIPFAHSEALSDTDKLLAAYFSCSTVGLCILDSELRYVALNTALANINRLPVDHHLGKTVREVLGDVADAIEPHLRTVLTTGQSVNFEASALLRTRSEIGHWVFHYLPIPDVAGKITRIGAVIVEITAQRKAEESLQTIAANLRKQMLRLQMLLDVSALLSSNWDVEKIFPRISARIRRVLRQEFASLTLHDADNGILVRRSVDFPFSKGFISDNHAAPLESPAGRALQTRSALMFSAEQMRSFPDPVTDALLTEGIRSLCCVPLLAPTIPLGVLILGSTRSSAFQHEDLALLNQIAIQLGIAIENQRVAGEIAALKARLAEEKKHLEGEVRCDQHFAEVVGESPELLEVLAQVSIVADSQATVLILGETGTGKDLVAHAIHRSSRRKDGPFVKLNCAAIPTGLLESELFGHEKGAFTGAVAQKVGRMELADGGTLFLDEIGEIPLELQPKLLRVLQDQEFERLGSNRTIRVNVRLVSATNRDLARDMAQHQFRSDLFYRLSVFPIHVPPLRERQQDIPALVRHFVRKFALRMNRPIESIPTETMRALTEWSWPGNVRELENLMERSVILSQGNALRVPLWEMQADGATAAPFADHTLDNAEREHILRILRECGGVLSGVGGAAGRLGLKRTTLQSKMLRLKITRRDYSGT